MAKKSKQYKDNKLARLAVERKEMKQQGNKSKGRKIPVL